MVLWEDRVGVGIATKQTTDGSVHHQLHGTGGHVLGVLGPLNTIDVPDDAVAKPLHAIGVIGIGETGEGGVVIDVKTFRRDDGISTRACRAIVAFRIRDSMSAIGSVIS